MNRRRSQRGDSLIGIMVALAISLLTAIAMLGAYRLMIGTSVPATRTAKREGQAASALLTAQIELQQAGFGIGGTDAGPTIYLDPSDKKKLVWRFRQSVGGDIYCAGLKVQATTAATDGIYFLLPKTCTDAQSATGFESRLLATASVMFEPPTAAADCALTPAECEARSYDLSRAEFEISASPNCGPYGVPGSRPGTQLVQLKDTGNDAVIFSHCLSNL